MSFPSWGCKVYACSLQDLQEISLVSHLSLCPLYVPRLLADIWAHMWGDRYTSWHLQADSTELLLLQLAPPGHLRGVAQGRQASCPLPMQGHSPSGVAHSPCGGAGSWGEEAGFPRSLGLVYLGGHWREGELTTGEPLGSLAESQEGCVGTCENWHSLGKYNIKQKTL